MGATWPGLKRTARTRTWSFSKMTVWLSPATLVTSWEGVGRVAAYTAEAVSSVAPRIAREIFMVSPVGMERSPVRRRRGDDTPGVFAGAKGRWVGEGGGRMI